MKYIVFLSLLLAFPISTDAQIYFGPQQVIISNEISVDAPEFVYSADLDGDGDLDILSASRGDNKIAWHENLDGFGVYGTQKLITTDVDYVFAVYAEDLDGDGDLDILSASWVDDKIAWYENLDGLGDFGAQQIISIEADGASSVYTADIDNDGYMDVLSASFFDSSIKWYRNEDGLGSFGTPQVISNSILSAYFVTAADIDDDGDMDVFCTSQGTDKVAWFENVNGMGLFSTQQIISLDMDGANFLNIADVNGDGNLDVIAAAADHNKIAWFENTDGNGNFGSQNVVSWQAEYVQSIQTGDFDGDGDIDLVAAIFDENKIVWYENEDGQGDFGAPQTISLEHTGATSVFATDLDQDGDIDVIAASRSDDKIAWYENTDSEGNFNIKQIIATQARGARAVHSADLDSDGDMDILSASQSDDRIFWYKNVDGNGTFKIQQIITSQADFAESVFAADLDGDSDLDVLSASGGDDKIAWYENIDGNGTFGPQQIITSQQDGASFVYAIDLDGDGDNDVLSASLYDNQIGWYENLNGSGSFGGIQEISSNVVSPRFVHAADIDGDGDIDVLSASADDNRVAWYENLDGLGDFGAQQNISVEAEAVYSVYANDLDNDGDLDVLAALRFGNKILWYENENGQGSFGSAKIITSQAYNPWQAFASDMDNDGDLDVLGALRSNNELAWYENTNGDFGAKQSISDQVEVPQFIITADLDNDGDQDVISASWLDGKVAWYENLFQEAVVSGICYYDENENALRDSGELVLFNQPVMIEPASIIGFSDSSGRYGFVVENGDYTVSMNINDNWQLTNDPPDYEITIQDMDIEDLDFGLIPVLEIADVETTVTSAPIRCGFDVPMWINYENTGTTYASGLIEFEVDPLATFISSVPSPDSIEDNYYYWYFDSLPPTYDATIDVIVEMPGVDFIGEILTFISSIYLEDDFGDLFYHYSYAYREEVNCAYDPNDKLVLPAGEQDPNYTLFGEELEYTIRFQNTGTDTAFTVRLEDYLDENLDWTTFRPVAASHPYEVTLNQQNGLVEFVFNNILLPDSMTNELKSHGFAKYRISHIAGLPESTEIENTANIFFDFNPAIQTNTTLNTMVSEMPVSTKNPSFKVKLEVFPNPFDDFTTIRVGELPGIEAIVNLQDINGRLLKTQKISPNSEIKIGDGNLPNGIYIYVLKSEESEILESGKIVKQKQ